MPSIEDLASAEVFDLALDWLSQGRKVAIATVTGTWGSAPRRPGSRLLVDADGNFAGSVSGGCIENAVILESQAAIDEDEPRELSFGVSDEEAWEVGLACGGEISLLVCPLKKTDAETLGRIRAAQRERRPLVCATRPDNGKSVLLDGGEKKPAAAPPEKLRAAADRALREDRPAVAEAGGTRWFVEPFNPRPRLVVVGAVHIAQALCGMAPLVGFEIFVVDPRDSWIKRERFPEGRILCAWPEEAFGQIGIDARTAVATLAHDPKIDDPALLLALSGGALYVGALGSAKTHASRLRRLEEEGVAREDCARIHAPIGLDIGGAVPAEIALAIMAEVVSAFRGGGKRGK